MDNDKDKTDSGRVTPVTPATPASPTRPAKTYVHPFAAAGHGQHRPNKNGGRSAKTSSGIHDVLDDSRSGRSAHSGHSRASSYSRRERTMAGHNFAATSPPSVKTKAPTFTTLATLVAEAETDKEDDFQPQSPLSIPDAESVNESRSSSIHVFNPPKPSEIFALLPPLPLPPPLPPVEPSFLALFTISPWKDGIFYLVPAVIFSIAAGFVLPYMALMVGNAFSALASYPRDVLTATDEQKRILMHDVGVTSVSFVAAGALGVLANYLMTVLWIRYSENTTSALRRMIFAGVEGKPMAWFDLSMGLQEEDANKIGAGGLMAKFTRETDEVRLAAGVSLGAAIKAISSIVICVILGFVKQPLLSLVILSSYPVVMIIHAVNQHVQGPLYQAERRGFAEASTLVERTVGAIATVKAFNAQGVERNRFIEMVNSARTALYRQAWRWATTIAGVSFLLLVMFVAGFWYAAILVSQGKSDIAKVMTAFWACLLASTSTQDVVTQMAVITKGKMSLASLLTIIQEAKAKAKAKAKGNPADDNAETKGASAPPSNDDAETKAASGPAVMSWGKANQSSKDNGTLTAARRSKFRGYFHLKDVHFAYPSRPEVKVLRGIVLDFPDAETTFVVGGSGSGKSTIAQLLLRMYTPDFGTIQLDSTSLASLSPNFCREHIAAVQQGCILFDMSVHDNVAMGLVGGGINKTRQPEDVTRDEVIEACRMAHIHDFIESLPEGYDTKLGTSGSALSGGQRQRLAIARARIRDPTVLILDEATSALDATSRIIVFDAIRAWRKDRMTIVITHDLSQIGLNDFVYVMKDGIVAEQGFRGDLMKHNAVFATMSKEQALQPLAPREDESWQDAAEVQELIDDVVEEVVHQLKARPASVASFYVGVGEDIRDYRTRQELGIGLGHPSGLNGESSFRRRTSLRRDSSARRESRFLTNAARRSYDPKTLAALTAADPAPATVPPTSPVLPLTLAQKRLSWSADDLKNGPYHSAHRRQGSATYSTTGLNTYLRVSTFTSVDAAPPAARTGFMKRLRPKSRGTFKLIPRWFATVPNKPLLYVGLAAGVAHGVCTPLWSFYIAKMINLVGAGDTHGVAHQGGILVAVSAAQGAAEWLKYWALFRVAAQWTAQIRDEAFTKVLAQDKAWFDESENAPQRLLQNLIKDVDDMRHLIATVVAGAIVVIVMVNVSVIWSLAVGWKLTLVGIAIAPVYIGVVAFTDSTTGRAEEKNKGYREALAKTFYESVANVRGIRAMALEHSFHKRFTNEAHKAKRQATTAAWITSFGAAFAFGMPLFTQALMNYVGARFIRDGEMSFEAMLQVYTLILFAITFTGQLLGFLPMVAKCRAAAYDFDRLHSLDTETVEKRGVQRYPINGDISFEDVSFAYPTRPDVPVLKNLNLRIYPNESVAIVGPSGCGKSTLAALIQRLYEPTSGVIRLGDHTLATAEVTYLRNHIGVVSQTASLFDASVAENISYGAPNIGRAEIIRACKEANINGFILSLPDGYDTSLGENASLISGGQAQRLQIARALVRHAAICVLDECTSALDVENQRILLDAIQRIKETSTTIFVTHSLEAMRRCGRIICLDDGRVAEDGTYDELIAKGGVFARLMATGEWE